MSLQIFRVTNPTHAADTQTFQSAWRAYEYAQGLIELGFAPEVHQASQYLDGWVELTVAALQDHAENT